MGSRLTASGTERVYAAADMWVKRALWVDDSLFTPGKPIWSKRVLEEAHKRFLDNPDVSSASFLDKLKGQLKDGTPDAYQLMGEALYFYFLIVSTRNSSNEEQKVNDVLSWSPNRVEIPKGLVAGLTPGIARPGTRFFIDRPFQVGFLIEFAEQLKAQRPANQRRLLGDPWKFKDFVMGLEFRTALMQEYADKPLAQREALFHLVFPDTFEAITSVDQKERIAKAFSDPVAQAPDDVDRQLKLIRQDLEDRYDGGDHLFHMPEIRGQWDESYRRDLWDNFVRRAQAYVDSGRLETEEIEYKVRAGRKLDEARTALRDAGEQWAVLLKDALKPNEVNFIAWQQKDNLNKWCAGHPDEASRALEAIWKQGGSSVAERIRDFSGLITHPGIKGAGTRANVASVLLMGLDVYQYPPFRVTDFNKAYDLTGHARPDSKADEVALYDHALGFLDRFIEEASVRGLELRHRLDAQSVVWGVLQNGDVGPGGNGKPTPDNGKHAKPEPWSPANVESLAEELLWQTACLAEDHRRPARTSGRRSFRGRPAPARPTSPSASPSTVESTAATSRSCSSTPHTPTRTSWRASGPRSPTAKPASSSRRDHCA